MNLVAYNVKQFMEILASQEPAPGGGSAAALLGAVGSALGTMVARLTAGREKYRDQEALVQEILQDGQALMQEFLLLIDRDTEAFNAVADAMKMPKSTEEERVQRILAMEKALKFAAQVPFDTMNRAVQALRVLRKAVHNTNNSAVSDLGVAAFSMTAALQGGWLNVLINLHSLKDEAFIRQYEQAGKSLLAEGLRLAEEIQQEVLKAL